MRCPKCSKEVNEGFKFCSNCGYKFTQAKVTLDEKEFSRLSGNQAIKVIGWIFLPFVMVFASWKTLRGTGKFFGVIWAVFVVISAINTIDNNNTKQYASFPEASVVTTALESAPAPIPDQGAKKKTDEEVKSKKEADDKAKAEAAAKAKADALEKAPHIGEVATVGKLEVSVFKGQLQSATVGYSIINQKAKGMYWEVGVAVTNKDKESRTIDGSMFKLVAADGTTYDPDTTAGMYANKDSHFFLEKINPGISITGYVVFDMPMDKMNSDDFILRVDSGMGFKGGSHVDFVLKRRD